MDLNQETTQTEDLTHPLRLAVEAAVAALETATDFVDLMNNDDEVSGDDPLYIAATAAQDVAQTTLDAAREALSGSYCPREWRLLEGGHEYDTVTADSSEEALDAARENCDRSNYSDSKGTLWIDVKAVCDETGEEDEDTVTLYEGKPDCSESEHDWQQSHELFGGCKQNPGVWGHGGGVVIHEVCAHCGCKKVTDTWAQRPDTGEQGLMSVSYEPEAFTVDQLIEAGLQKA